MTSKSHSQPLLVFRTYTHIRTFLSPFCSPPGPASSVSCPSLGSSNPSRSPSCRTLSPASQPESCPSSHTLRHSPAPRSLLLSSQDSLGLLVPLPSEQVNRTSGITTECLPVKGILLLLTWCNLSPQLFITEPCQGQDTNINRLLSI